MSYEEIKDLLSSPLDGESERSYSNRMTADHPEIEEIYIFARVYYNEIKI